MTEDTVVRLRQPGTFSEDPLTEVFRLGARRLLAQAVEMAVTALVEGHADLRDGEAVDRRSSGPSVRPNGRRRIVRHGDLPGRAIQTGMGPVSVRRPRVRDRGASSAVGCTRERQRAQQAPQGRPATRQANPTGHLDGLIPRRWRRRPATPSARPMAPSATRRPPAWPRTGTFC